MKKYKLFWHRNSKDSVREVELDKLNFCREHLEDLPFDELIGLYNLLSFEYGDGEFLMENRIENIMDILELMFDYDLSVWDWLNSIYDSEYCPSDKLIGLKNNVISSYNDDGFVFDFVSRKLNGECVELVYNYLCG